MRREAAGAWNLLFIHMNIHTEQQHLVQIILQFSSSYSQSSSISLSTHKDLASIDTFDISSQSTSTRQTSAGSFISDAASGVSTRPRKQLIWTSELIIDYSDSV